MHEAIVSPQSASSSSSPSRSPSSAAPPATASAPGRYLFHLIDHWAVVVIKPVDAVVIVGFFFGGHFLGMTEEAAGEA